jgi:hypothetical protein
VWVGAGTKTEAIELALDLVISEHRRNQLAAEANKRYMTSGIDQGRVRHFGGVDHRGPDSLKGNNILDQ